MPNSFRHFMRLLGASLLLAQAAAHGQADAPAPAGVSVRDLAEQNRQLQQKVDAQQQQIDELRTRLDRMQKDNASATAPVPVSAQPEPPARELPSFTDSTQQVRISGEAGLAFFSGGSDSAYPNSEFAVDDAKIFVEAPVWHNVYFFGEMDLMTRENSDDYFHIGELYVDMDDVFSSGRNQRLNLRIGHFNIPFGEEYQYRGVMEDPLVTHSVSDLWGYDTGVEAYGTFDRLSYNVAVQNGGVDKNKAVTARIGFEPIKSLHLSVSAHNTGKLDEANDFASQIWFGGAFFRGLAPNATTHSFDVSVFEADASWKWKDGHVRIDGGTAEFEDDNLAADDSRRINYDGIEVVQQITTGLYGAARYSEVRASQGYPVMGQGNGGKYFYNPFAPLTTDLQRLSLGVGYEFGPPFVWKLEYSWERGHLVGGLIRDNEDLLSTEIGIRF